MARSPDDRTHHHHNHPCFGGGGGGGSHYSHLALPRKRRARRQATSAGVAGWFCTCPLLLPQAAFLFGVQILLLSLGLSGSFLGVLWAHFLFALPYGFLVLASPWRSADPRYASLARSLGHGARTVFLRVRCRMLLPHHCPLPLRCAFRLALPSTWRLCWSAVDGSPP